uniref:GATOR2 complex protein WDR24 n=1 Tax=Acrobeloides nanus TaxID=290746 RepID=A0A914D3B2_9BILA
MNVRKKRNVVLHLHEPIDALCATRSHSMVAVAGRNILKVFGLKDDRFEPKLDLRKSKQKLFFSGSVSWSPLKENWIASSSTTGTVNLWDLETQNYVSLSHNEPHFRSHKAVTTKVCFHEFNENLLVSGSKDGTIWLYDTRLAEPVQFFSASQESIRDIQFGLDSAMEDLFVVADDSGSVRFWDIKKGDRPLREFRASPTIVFSVALNPQGDSKSLIATGGRDKFIRVWDWSKVNPDICYSVETMASVGRVVWCPDNNWHVASCFNMTDNSIHIWDIRRPYLPYAAFNDHNQLCTDISWSKGSSADKFVSCGKDGLLVLHYMENAHRPIQYANNVALDYGSTCDEVVFAVPSRMGFPMDRRSNDPFGRKQPSFLYTANPKDPFIATSQNIVFLAKNYKLLGDSVEELCDHNAIIAEQIGEEHVAYTWRMIGLLCTQSDIASNRPKLKSDSHQHHSPSADLKKDDHRRSGGVGQSSDEEDRLNSVNNELLLTGTIPQSVQQSLATSADFFFGLSELNLDGLMFGGSNEMMISRSCSRLSLVSSVDIMKLKEEAFDSLDEADEDSDQEEELLDDLDDENQESNRDKDNEISVYPGAGTLPTWDSLPMLKTALEYYSNRGDVQTCASICLVIGEKITKLIPENQVELWIFSYLEILERLNLWNTSALIIKLCYRPRINQLSNESTFVKIYCKKCKTTSMSASPKCRKCKQNYYLCCICEAIVKIGIWVECPDCGHGGHQFHIEQWFSKFNHCPVAMCNCECRPIINKGMKRDASGSSFKRLLV